MFNSFEPSMPLLYGKPMRLLLESLQRGRRGKTLCLLKPETILSTQTSSQVSDVLRELQKAISQGYSAIGFLTYDAGASLLPASVAAYSPSTLPLVWFALTKSKLQSSLNIEPQPYEIHNLHLNLTREQYRSRIESIKRKIENGETYQVNFTMR